MPASDYRRAELEAAIRKATPCGPLDDPCSICKRAVTETLDLADRYARTMAVERIAQAIGPHLRPAATEAAAAAWAED